MDPGRLHRIDDCEWMLPQTGAMRVPGVIFADEALVREMDDKVPEQVANVATLPGIVKASFAMPDAHWGYGFPIGGVAAFDPDEGGVVSAGGVGFDISCGVRTLLTGLTRVADRTGQAAPCRRARRAHSCGRGQHRRTLASRPTRWTRCCVAARVGRSRGATGIRRTSSEPRSTAVMAGAEPQHVSAAAKRRQRDEMGTLGSGNHYLEVQHVVELYDRRWRASLRARGRATSSSASTAGRAASATRSAPSSCGRWR